MRALRSIAARWKTTDSLRSGAAKADAVIHLAFDHDFSHFVEDCVEDKRAIAALGSALGGSDRPLLITSGTGVGSRGDGQPATEDGFNTTHPNPRIGSEVAGNALLEAGINVSVMRLPQVHNPFRQGLIMRLLNRTTRSVSLTDAGLRLLDQLRPAFGQIGGALEDLNRQRASAARSTSRRGTSELNRRRSKPLRAAHGGLWSGTAGRGNRARFRSVLYDQGEWLGHGFVYLPVVDAHGGRLSVKPNVPRGAVFQFTVHGKRCLDAPVAAVDCNSGKRMSQSRST
jgi:hypothetical protein